MIAHGLLEGPIFAQRFYLNFSATKYVPSIQECETKIGNIESVSLRVIFRSESTLNLAAVHQLLLFST